MVSIHRMKINNCEVCERPYDVMVIDPDTKTCAYCLIQRSLNMICESGIGKREALLYCDHYATLIFPK